MKQLTYTSLLPTEDGNGFVDANGKIWQPLNSKQKKFCKEYFKGQTATESAIKAGYTKDRKGAKTQGSVLLNHNPVVRNRSLSEGRSFSRESFVHSTRPQRRGERPRSDIRCHHSRGPSRQSWWTLHR